MKLAIIGAGAAGLASLKYGLDQGHECDVYEKTGNVGGLWVYREKTHDQNGFAISSPMYDKLRTNLPKETMEFLDFPYPRGNESYVSRTKVLDYFQRFAASFSLMSYIMFHTLVTRIEPTQNTKWNVTFQQFSGKKSSKLYDAVFICTGHYNVPKFPQISGNFKGQQMHSVSYRRAENYRNKNVLVIGSSASGVDISGSIAKFASRVFLSHRSPLIFNLVEEVVKKGEVARLEGDSVAFKDGTKERIDVIIYCTGYRYDFPFLSENSGIKWEDNWVRYLYKQVVNIQHPTMFFIGIPQGLCVIPMCDIQARFALASLNNHFNLPIKEDMLDELNKYMKEKQLTNGFRIEHAHKLGGQQTAYFGDLATTARIRPIPAVVNKIYDLIKFNRDPSQCIDKVDDENYVLRKCLLN